jgi:hypothetical protein
VSFRKTFHRTSAADDPMTAQNVLGFSRIGVRIARLARPNVKIAGSTRTLFLNMANHAA